MPVQAVPAASPPLSTGESDAPPPVRRLSLENGDRLTRREFERRYATRPDVKKAELIEGVVYLSAAVRLTSHGEPHAAMAAWLGSYVASTPGVRAADNATVRLDLDNEPQPDVLLRIEPQAGGQSRVSDDNYLERAPELVVEIAAGSVSYDLHDKLRVYRRNGVREYVVWRIQDPVRFAAMIVDPYFYLAAAVAVLIVGMAKGGFGGGIAVVGVPLMAMVVSPFQAAAVMLPILMVMDVLAMRAYWSRWDWRNLRILLPAAMLGTLLGFVTARAISADGLRVLVAVVALVYAVQYFRRRPGDRTRPPRTGPGVFWGATAGFTSFSIHAGGPPLQAFLLPQRMHRTTFQATSVLFFFVVNWSKVGPYYWLGQWTTDNLLTSLVLLPLAPVGVFLGRYLHDRVDDELFFRVVHASLFVIGVKLLYDASGA